MATELECKLPINDLSNLTKKLISLGYVFESKLILQDTLFKHPHHEALPKESTLRIRQIIKDNTLISSELCYKGLRQEDKLFKCRQELETAIDDPKIVQSILNALGYYSTLSYQKQRTTYTLDHVKVCLDTVPYLGDFIEIEAGTDNEITKVLTKLSLSAKDHISTGYPKLLKAKIETLFPNGAPKTILLDI